MKQHKYAAFALSMLLAVTVCPAASADTILATLKDGVVTQTTLSENVAPSIETSAEEQESPGFWEQLLNVFRWREPVVEETSVVGMKNSTDIAQLDAEDEVPSDPGTEEPSVTVSDMSVETVKNKKVTGTLTSSEFDSETYHFEIETEPTNGTASIIDQASGSFEYTPNTDYIGADSFTFKLVSSDYTTPVATVNITVQEEEAEGDDENGEDDATVKVNDMSIETEKNKKITGTLSSSAFDSSEYHFEIETEPTNGTATILDQTTGNFEYTPNTDYTGTDSFTFKLVSDGYTTPVATVSITIREEIVTPPPVETASIYDDMVNHYARAAAEWLYEENHVKGETVAGDTFFYPDYNMTRVQFVTFANSVFFPNTNTETTALELPFVDITDETLDYVVRAAGTAYKNEFVSGSNDEGKLYFKPYENLTRLQVVIMLHNVLKPAEAADVSLDFTDAADIPEYAIGYVRDMLNIGMIRGFDDGSFQPNALISRAQVAQLLYNAMRYKGDSSILQLK